jgi:hypothetical protein
MILRSFLFVPADSERKLAKAKSSRADALILDLEDAVAADKRPAARALAREYLQSEKGGASLWVRVNPYGTADCQNDLEAIVAAAPAGLVVPKPETPDVLRELDRDLSVLEMKHGLPSRGIAVMPVASETPVAALTLGDYRNPPPRLAAITWGAEDLSAALGAVTNRDDDGRFAFTYRMVRSMCLLAAKGGRRRTDRYAARRFPRYDRSGEIRARRAARRVYRHARDPSRSGRSDQRRVLAVGRRRRTCAPRCGCVSRAAQAWRRSTARCSISRI